MERYGSEAAIAWEATEDDNRLQKAEVGNAAVVTVALSGSDNYSQSEVIRVQGQLGEYLLEHFDPSADLAREQLERRNGNQFDRRMEGWTWTAILKVVSLLVVCGVLEVGGGWGVWKTIRDHSPWYYAAIGSLSLVAYGFVVTVQPVDNFGRIFAAYGGVFIVMSFIWAMIFDKKSPDIGDMVGTVCCLIGTYIILFYPR